MAAGRDATPRNRTPPSRRTRRDIFAVGLTPSAVLAVHVLASAPCHHCCGRMARALASAYLRSLERRPVITKSCTSFCTFSVTDILAQQRERSVSCKPQEEGAWDPVRTCRGGLFGLLYLGPSNHLLWGKRWGLECARLPSATQALQLPFQPRPCVWFAGASSPEPAGRW